MLLIQHKNDTVGTCKRITLKLSSAGIVTLDAAMMKLLQMTVQFPVMTEQREDVKTEFKAN